MRYTVYGLQNITRLIVAGGGLMNGNDCAYIEYLTDEPDGKIWYCESGENPTSELVGKSGITYIDDCDEFKINDPLHCQICGNNLEYNGQCYDCEIDDSGSETPTSVLDTPFN